MSDPKPEAVSKEVGWYRRTMVAGPTQLEALSLYTNPDKEPEFVLIKLRDMPRADWVEYSLAEFKDMIDIAQRMKHER